MKSRLLAATVLLAAAVTVPFATPAPTARADDPVQLGGYAARVVAAPLVIRVYEPVFPLPAEPQGELDIAYTQAISGTGPNHRATASTVWPGAALGDGFGVITEAMHLGHHDYPVQANATYPTGSRESSRSMGVARMSARVAERFATATAAGGPGVDLPSAAGSGVDARSTSTTVLGADSVTAHGVASARDLVLAGLLRIRGIDATATASSNGSKASAGGRSVYAGVELAGTPLTVEQDGVHAGGQRVDWPGLPTDPNEALRHLGITLTRGTTTKSVDGPNAAYTSFALRVTVDTLVLRERLAPTGYRELYTQLWSQILRGLPKEIRREIEARVPSLADLGPIVVYDIGYVSVSAAAVPPFEPDFAPDLGELPPNLPDGPLPDLPVDGGGYVPPLAPTGTVSDDAPLPRTFERPVRTVAAPTPFGGLPPSALVLALLAAALVAFGLRRLAVAAGIMPGSDTGCRLGADVGVPTLRDEG